jgi:hypothetical protein
MPCRVDHPTDMVHITDSSDPLLAGTGWTVPSASSSTAAAGTPAPSPCIPAEVSALKARGDQLYLGKSYIDALHAWNQGLAALAAAAGSEETLEAQQMRAFLLCNCAATCLAFNTPEASASATAFAQRAVDAATSCSNITLHAKALLRMGQGLMGMCR